MDEWAGRPPRDLRPLWIWYVLGVVFLGYAIGYNTGEIRELKAKARRLEAEVATLKDLLDIDMQTTVEENSVAVTASQGKLAVLAEDIDVCHKRATDIQRALDAVARTVPWRARPPHIPDRPRPRGGRHGPSVPNPRGGP